MTHDRSSGSNDAHRPERRHPADWARIAVPLLVIAALIGGAWKLGYFDLSDPERLRETTRKLNEKAWVVPAFIAAYAACAALAVPTTPLSYIGGALFGFTKGGIVVMSAQTLGGVLGYLLARGIMAKPAERLLGRYRDKVKLPNGKGAFMATMRLQLVPVIPFSVVTYAAGISRVPIVAFVAATIVGGLPMTLATVFVGHEVMSGLQGGGRKPLLIGIGVAVAILAISLAPLIRKRLKR